LKAYKTELDPNNEQKTGLKKHAGAARWAYNWGLARRKKLYNDLKQHTNAISLHKDLNKLKGTPDLSWGYEVSKCAFQEALRDLDQAFKNFFDGLKGKRRPEGTRVGFPRFKSKKKGLGGFRLTGSIKVLDGSIQLPRLGLIRLKEHGYIPSDAKILSVTVSERAGRWFVSVLVDDGTPDIAQPTGEPIGIDLGISYLAVTSDGEFFDNPKALNAKTKRLVRWQRWLSRRVKGSKNRDKARRMVAKIHFDIANIGKDARNKLVASLVSSKPTVIVLETLNVKGLIKNHKLAKALSDASLGAVRLAIETKAKQNGIAIVKANRFYPSSQLCSDCGNRKSDLKLSDRTYLCAACGCEKPRDLNAALNLKSLVQQIL
jgi:putative transposase